MNLVPAALAAAVVFGGIALIGIVWYYFSPEYTDVGYRPVQPVPYSHKLHAGDLGLDCRYCHTTVEIAAVAAIPPVQTCMNCHAIIKTDSEKLQPIRDSYETGQPIEWIRVHNLPDYAYFNHSMHVNAGVGCISCHGNVAQMEVVMQMKPLSMGWCLDCHRDPGPHLRPKSEVTNMDWQPPANGDGMAVASAHVQPSTDCVTCHR
jgi:hypothetical protein